MIYFEYIIHDFYKYIFKYLLVANKVEYMFNVPFLFIINLLIVTLI